VGFAFNTVTPSTTSTAIAIGFRIIIFTLSVSRDYFWIEAGSSKLHIPQLMADLSNMFGSRPRYSGVHGELTARAEPNTSSVEDVFPSMQVLCGLQVTVVTQRK
jgi:hypothetical protein